MATASKTITRKSGTKIEVKVTRSVVDDVAYADGWNIKTGRKTSDLLDITIITPDGKKIWGSQITKHGSADARVGKASLSDEAYNEIMATIAELDAALVSQDPEYATLKQAETAAEAKRREREEANLRRMESEYRERAAHPGWCNKCHSYCYGDCEASQKGY